jgi:hypothetical protein
MQQTREEDEFEKVGSKGKRLNAFTKASAFSDDSAESDSSEDFRVPKMLSVALDKNNV